MRVLNYDVEVELTEPLLGTVPKNKEVYTQYIESKRPEDQAPGGAVAEAETVEDLEEKGWTGFHSDETGLFVYDYYIKGFFKNAANILKDEFSVPAFRSKINDYVFVYPRRVHLGGLKEPSDILERPIRVMTMQGPRVSIIRSDLVAAGTVIKFRLEYIENKKFKPEFLEQLMEYGKRQGFGQWRNGSYGRFVVKKFELVSEG